MEVVAEPAAEKADKGPRRPRGPRKPKADGSSTPEAAE
jgi:hypothetical protein